MNTESDLGELKEQAIEEESEQPERFTVLGIVMLSLAVISAALIFICQPLAPLLAIPVLITGVMLYGKIGRGALAVVILSGLSAALCTQEMLGWVLDHPYN